MAQRGDGAVEELGGRTAILQAQTEASGAAFVAVSLQGVLRSHNEAFASMWGLPTEVLEKGTLPALVDWLRANAGEIGAALVTLLTEQDERTSGELTLCDGRVLEWRTARIRGEGGRVWALHDVTASRQLASALRDAGNLLRIFEAHADGVVLELDDGARIVGIWAAHAGFFDKPDATLQGRGMDDAIGLAQGARLEAVVRRVFATRQRECLEYLLDRGGERRVFSANAVFVPSSDDESPRVAVMIRDLSERMRLQTQLLEAEWLVSVGLLAAGVAHEINNPLAYSLLNLERIQRGLRDLARSDDQPAITELIDAVGVSLEGCRRVQAIVQDLRRFSASGRDDEVRGPIDVRRVLDFAIDMVAPQVLGRAQVVREFGQVPLVIANEGPLSQVFLNLIVNAAQAIPEGEPDGNEVRVVTYTDDGGRAIVEVRDTGQGISPSVLPHIFDPFYTTRAPGVGTGLGLAICQRIATSLGGSLGVQTEVGRGSVFRCVLPAAPDAATGPTTAPEPSGASHGASPVRPSRPVTPT